MVRYDGILCFFPLDKHFFLIPKSTLLIFCHYLTLYASIKGIIHNVERPHIKMKKWINMEPTYFICTYKLVLDWYLSMHLVSTLISSTLPSLYDFKTCDLRLCQIHTYLIPISIPCLIFYIIVGLLLKITQAHVKY